VVVEGSQQFHEVSDGKGFDVITMVRKKIQSLYALARTTTPWTIPCNIALAVNQEKTYIQVRHEDKEFILAKARLEEIFKGKDYTIIRELSGSDLV
jgi:isoleucyl-tRNA synthetase